MLYQHYFFTLLRVALSAVVALGIGFAVLQVAQAEGVVEVASPPIAEEVPFGPLQEDRTDSLTYEPVMYVFHSVTCPHCRKLNAFLDTIEPKYPNLEIRRIESRDASFKPMLTELAMEYHIEDQMGFVPITFIGPKHFVGYQSDRTTGTDIESAIRDVLGVVEGEEGVVEGVASTSRIFDLPFVGVVDSADHSLPMLAILLGFLDGFNVCSLGALVLIIGLTLKLQRRRAIILFGGLFILTTALVYGALIVLWYKLFAYVGGYLDIMKVGVALLSLGGALYFFKEYFRMLRQGAVCQMQESPWIQRMSEHAGKAFEDTSKLVALLGAVVAFAFVVAVVEFPCSAAVPVVFAGILADAGLSTMAYLAHIGLFVLFYMLDEILIFAVAAYRLKIWMMNGTFTKWAVLGEAVILLAIGFYYLSALLGVI